MPFRLYIVPVIGTATHGDPRRAKYFEDSGTIATHTDWIDYGFEPWMFVGGSLTPAEDAFIVAQPDAMALPVDLTPTLTAGQVTTVQNKLEAMNVPAGWVNTSLTWLTVVRTVLGVFSYIQHYGAVYDVQNGTVAPSIFTGGVSLNTTFGALPAAVQTAMTTAAQEMNISTAGLTAGTTLRVILKALADNFSGKVYLFGGTPI